MSKRLNLINNQFGRWTVIAFDKIHNKNSYWKCKCECGNIKSISGSSLKRGESISCGCYQKEVSKELGKVIGQKFGGWNKLPDNQAYWNRKYSDYKRAAEKRNYYFELTTDEVKEICLGECYYCGTLPNPYNGIDRVDNESGYTIDNVVSCCKYCNIAKNDLSAPDFILHAQKIVEYQMRK